MTIEYGSAEESNIPSIQGISACFCYVHGENAMGKAFYVKQSFAHDSARDADEE